MHARGWARRRSAALRRNRKCAVVTCADRIVFANRFSSPSNEREEHCACRDGECNATERNGEEESRRCNRDEKRRKARPWEVDPCRRGSRWQRGHSDLARTSASETEEDPRVESGDDEKDDDWKELDQRAPIRCNERPKEGYNPLEE